MSDWERLTSLGIVHPIEDYLGGSVPASDDVPRHLCVCLPSQPEVKDLRQTERIALATLDCPFYDNKAQEVDGTLIGEAGLVVIFFKTFYFTFI